MIYALGFGIPVLAGLLAAAVAMVAMHRAEVRDRVASLYRPPNYYC